MPPFTVSEPARTSMPESPLTFAPSFTVTFALPLSAMPTFTLLPVPAGAVTVPFTTMLIAFSVLFRLPSTNSVPFTVPSTVTSIRFFCASFEPNTFRPYSPPSSVTSSPIVSVRLDTRSPVPRISTGAKPAFVVLIVPSPLMARLPPASAMLLALVMFLPFRSSVTALSSLVVA